MTYLENGVYWISKRQSRTYGGNMVYKCNDGLWTINSFVDREKRGTFKTLKDLRARYGW